MSSVGIHELKRDSEGYTQKTNQKYASDVVTLDAPGQLVLMSGAEAIARGAIEAGTAVAASFPGSPATWVHENLLLAHSKLDEFYVEWSTSENKSWDVALGAALAGRRAFVPLKQVGVNWIVDGVSDWVTKRALRAGLVILSGDDPGADTTSREQDTRLLCPFLELPLLQAASVQEQKDVIIEAFDLSERMRAPVMVSITRQMMYGRGPVQLGQIDHARRRLRSAFPKDPDMGYTWLGDIWSTTGIADKHGKYHAEALTLAQEHAENSPLNRLDLSGGERIGIVTGEQAYTYAKQAVHALGLDGQVAFLKLGTTWPIPCRLTSRLLTSIESVVVIEELEPFIENQVRALSSTLAKHARIYGKQDGIGLPYHDAFNMDIVAGALAKVLGIAYAPSLTPAKKMIAEQLQLKNVPDRPFTLCAGCPEMGALWIIREAFKQSKYSRTDVLSVVDEGCFIASETEPWKLGDVATCMGSSISIAHGLSTGVDKKLLVQIGDGGFLHNGIQGLINAVHNNAKMTVFIHDNFCTAATGQQPVASGFGKNSRGENAPRADIARLCDAIGVKLVRKLDPFDIKSGIEIFREALEYDGISVVISEAPCSIVETRRVGSRGQREESHLATYRIDPDKCTSCTLCSRLLGCLAIEDMGAKVPPIINEIECIGCDVCLQMCPDDAIFRVTEKAEA